MLSEDSDLSFSGDTLTAKIGAFTAAGAIDFGNQAMTNVDINSGAIDGAVIGGAFLQLLVLSLHLMLVLTPFKW